VQTSACRNASLEAQGDLLHDGDEHRWILAKAASTIICRGEVEMSSTSSRPILVSGFGILLLILVTIAVTGILQVTMINNQLQRVVHQHNQRINLMTIMRNVVREGVITLQSMLLTYDSFEREELYELLSRETERYVNARNELMALPMAQSERELLERQQAISDPTRARQNRIAEQLIADNDEGARSQFLGLIVPAQRQALALMDHYIELQQRHNEMSVDEANRKLNTVIRTLLFLMLAGVAVGSAIAVVVIRRIERELQARIASEQGLQRSELRERLIRQNILDGIITTDYSGHILSTNRAVEVIFGYSGEALYGQPFDLLLHQNDAHRRIFQTLLQREEIQAGSRRELEGQRQDGEIIPIEMQTNRIMIENQPNLLIVVRDISIRKAHERLMSELQQELEQQVADRTHALSLANQNLLAEIEERRRAEERLAYLASHDSLTGLPNRRIFTEQLNLILRQAHRQQSMVAVYFLDLDGFKQVNDTWGHEVGDRLLIDVCKRIRRVLRESDVASRMGGDEFTLITADLHAQTDAITVAEKLIESIIRPFECSRAICEVGVSIGIALYPEHGTTAEELLKLADDAMYQVKRRGKRGYLFYQPKEESEA
jgi:diguanylate cyclase (GGDEF)-like protein/PAS domain S-box-containing protein